MVIEVFQKDSREIPMNKLIKEAYDYMDINKDGMIDQHEWSRSLGIQGV
jgi:Ca2+-binding EF-hand superfamily protein